MPGEQEYRNKGVAYCPHCDGPLYKGKKVAVIGGGNSGVEAAIDLAGVVEHVTLIEFADQLKADAVLVSKLEEPAERDVIHTNAQTTEITGDGQKVTGLRYRDRATGTSARSNSPACSCRSASSPTLSGCVARWSCRSTGEIVVDAKGATSVPGVFAAGDVTTTPFKQIIIAAGEGAKAALSAFDHLIRHSTDTEASVNVAPLPLAA